MASINLQFSRILNPVFFAVFRFTGTIEYCMHVATIQDWMSSFFFCFVKDCYFCWLACSIGYVRCSETYIGWKQGSI